MTEPRRTNWVQGLKTPGKKGPRKPRRCKSLLRQERERTEAELRQRPRF